MDALDRLWLMGDAGDTALATVGTLQANIKMFNQALKVGASLDDGALTEIKDLAVERLEMARETCALTNRAITDLVGTHPDRLA